LTRRLLLLCAFFVSSLFGGAPDVAAEPFTIEALLTGDIRLLHPDNIAVRLSVTGDSASNVTSWVVDLDSATLHPDMSLAGFFFNLDVNAANVLFSGATPVGWNVAHNATSARAQSSGGATFQFFATDPPRSANDVTNSVDLRFDATLTNGQLWTPALLLNAPFAHGEAIASPGAQVGAHLRTLSTLNCPTCAKASGFVGGNYTKRDVPSVPEPSMLMLFALGAAASIRWRRARH
jgi:hypothetical protein